MFPHVGSDVVRGGGPAHLTPGAAKAFLRRITKRKKSGPLSRAATRLPPKAEVSLWPNVIVVHANVGAHADAGHVDLAHRHGAAVVQAHGDVVFGIADAVL